MRLFTDVEMLEKTRLSIRLKCKNKEKRNKRLDNTRKPPKNSQTETKTPKRRSKRPKTVNSG